MNENKIQLGKFLKKENWEFHFAVGGIFEQSENFCFQKVCEEANRSNPVAIKVGYLETHKPHFAVVGLLDTSKDQAREFLEKAVQRTNEIMGDPDVVRYLTLRREIPLKPWPDKKLVEKQCQALEMKLREAGKYKFVGN